MSINANELPKMRDQYLEKLFEVSNASKLFSINFATLGDMLGFPGDISDQLSDYLADEGLLELTINGEISITHEGIVNVEESKIAINEPRKKGALINVIQVEKMIASQIQQGNNQSVQFQGTLNLNIEKVRDFVSLLKTNISDLPFSEVDREIVNTDIETIEAQLKSPKPKNNLIVECLKSIKVFLLELTQKVTASVIAGVLLESLEGVL